jgi:hypothetical protein
MELARASYHPSLMRYRLQQLESETPNPQATRSNKRLTKGKSLSPQHREGPMSA